MVISAEKPKRNGRGKDKNGRVMHSNSLKNLEKGTDWKPGETGNPKGQSITARQNQKMDDDCPYPVEGKTVTWREALAVGGMRQALTIPVALSNLQDRQEGKVTQPVDNTSPVVVNSFTFILPDGTKVSPKALGQGEPV